MQYLIIHSCIVILKKYKCKRIMWNDYKFFMDFTSHFLQTKFAFWELDRSEKYNMNFWNISAIYQCKHNTKRNTSYSMNEVYLFTTQKKSFRRDNKRFTLKVLLLITLKKILQIYMKLLWLILFKNLQFSELFDVMFMIIPKFMTWIAVYKCDKELSCAL